MQKKGEEYGQRVNHPGGIEMLAGYHDGNGSHEMQ